MGFLWVFCRGNSGPCGAGACLFLPNEERVDLKQPVSTRSSILLGELIAFKIALESINLEMKKKTTGQKGNAFFLLTIGSEYPYSLIGI